MPYPISVIVAGTVGLLALATMVGALLARAGFPVNDHDSRLGSVDGLRGYLALAVMAHHSIVWLQITRLGGIWDAPTVNAFNQLGSASVGLFFMVTGLVFYSRILAGLEGTHWPSLLIGRAFRILPLQIVSVAMITLIITARTGKGMDVDYPVAALTWLTSWGEPPLLGYADSGRLNAYVLWSLWYEWMFYLLILPAAAALRQVTRHRLPSWTIPAALFVLGILCRRSDTVLNNLKYLPLFAIGMAAFECRGREWLRSLFAGRVAAVAGVAALAIGAIGWSSPNPLPAMLLFGFFFVCVASGNSIFGLLRTRAALVLGECSFGIYLLHGTVLALLYTEGAGLLAPLATNTAFLLAQLIAAPVAVLASASAYLLVERPGIHLGKSLSAKFRRRQTLPPAQLEVAP